MHDVLQSFCSAGIIDGWMRLRHGCLASPSRLALLKIEVELRKRRRVMDSAGIPSAHSHVHTWSWNAKRDRGCEKS